MSLLRPLLKPHPRQHPSPTTFYCTTRCVSIGTPSRAGTLRDATRGSFEDVFISALVAAGSGRQQRTRPEKSFSCYRSPAYKSGRSVRRRHTQARDFSSQPQINQSAAAIASAEPDISQREYEDLVDVYPGFGRASRSSGEHASQVGKKREFFPLAPRLVLTPEQERRPPHGKREIIPPENEKHAQALRRLKKLLKSPFGELRHSDLWEVYDHLVPPRPRYISDEQYRILFIHLAWIEKRNEKSMQRYLDLLQECTREGVDVDDTNWNTGIAYAGRWHKKATGQQVKDAVELWMQMEQAGKRATNVTFNILFQVAVRAGRFALADTILNELKARGMPQDRYLRTSIIYYAGTREDGDAVRREFQAAVNAGEIIDTNVMNVVILALLRAGEAPAAEHVFLRMKALHKDKFGTLAPEHWRQRKAMTILLHQAGNRLRRLRASHGASFFGASTSIDDKKEEIQTASPIAPDSRTYRVLIKYHAYRSGDAQRVRELLDESRSCGHRIHGSVYLDILRGFHVHGGYSYSAWNRRGLEKLWSEILDDVAAQTGKPPKPVQDLSTTPHPPTRHGDVPDLITTQAPDESPFSARADDGAATPSDPLRQPSAGSARSVALSHQEQNVYFGPSMALAALRAFYKCAGATRMKMAWSEIQARWPDATGDEKLRIQDAVDGMASGDRTCT